MFKFEKRKSDYMLAKNIKKNDIFIYNGYENVAIDDYSDKNPYLWVTSRRCWIPEGANYVYGYTSATIVEIKPNEKVKYVGRME